MSLSERASPFNNEDNFDSSFQLETNLEFTKIMESVAENEENLLRAKQTPVNLNELLQKQKKNNSLQEQQQQKLTKRKKPPSMLEVVPRTPTKQANNNTNNTNVSRFSLMSDLSYPAIQDNSTEMLVSTPVSTTTNNNNNRMSSKRYSTISNGSSRILIQKRSNSSLRYGNNRMSANTRSNPYISGSSIINAELRSPSINNSRVLKPRTLERMNSTDSSVIGYRNSIRSVSTNMDNPNFQYFDSVSVNDEDFAIDDYDDDLMIGNRFSRLRAGNPGIVGVNMNHKNSNVTPEVDLDLLNQHNKEDSDVEIDDNNSTILSSSILSSSILSSSIINHRHTKSLSTSHKISGSRGTDYSLTVTSNMGTITGSTSSSKSSLPSPSPELLEIPSKNMLDGEDIKMTDFSTSITGPFNNETSPNSLSTESFENLRSMLTNNEINNNINNSAPINNIVDENSDFMVTSTNEIFDDSLPSKRSFTKLKSSIRRSNSIKRDASYSSNNKFGGLLSVKSNDVKSILSGNSEKKLGKMKSRDHFKNDDSFSSSNSGSSSSKAKRIVKKLFGRRSSSKLDSASVRSNNNGNKVNHKKSFSIVSKKSIDTLRDRGSISDKVTIGNITAVKTIEVNEKLDTFKKPHKRSISIGTANLKDKIFHHNMSTISLDVSDKSSMMVHSKNSLKEVDDLKEVTEPTEYSNLLNENVLSKYGKVLLNATPARKLAKDNYINYLDLHKLMNLCQFNNNLILDFEDFIELRLKEIKNRSGFKKIDDNNTFGIDNNDFNSNEIFGEVSLKNRKINNILKIIPFDGNEKNYTIKQAIQEMTIISKLQNCQGFINLKSGVVVKGEFSKHLLKEWDYYQITSELNNKRRPDYFNKSQLYLILVFDFGGPNLKNFEIKNWHQANKIFWNLTKVLKNSELLYKFEHRNLNWENILINESQNKDDQLYLNEPNNNSLSSFNESYAVKDMRPLSITSVTKPDDTDYSADLRISLIDFAYSRLSNKNTYSIDLMPLTQYKGSDKDRVQCYHSMIDEISSNTIQNIDNDNYEIQWENWCPRTNIIWLHYLVKKLVNNKNLEPILEAPNLNDCTKKSRSPQFSTKSPHSHHSSNSTVTKSILRKPKNSDSTTFDDNQNLFDINEYRSYTALQYILKSLDPKHDKKYNQKPVFKDYLEDFGNAFEVYKKTHFREDVGFSDFNTLDEVWKWGELNELII